jgi:hypothetical protein
MTFVDEGSGAHPADYESDAFLNRGDLAEFAADEQEQVLSAAAEKCGGYVVPLGKFSGELFDKLLRHKIYDFLPWETERPVMLDKWREFALSCDRDYVFNCVLLQNPMCETMMRFGFDEAASEAYIREISGIIAPLSPFVVYLKNSDINSSVKQASAERGDDWLNAVIDYHCSGEYGRKHGLKGFDGYIAALEERQRRELAILGRLGVEHIVLEDPQNDWVAAYADILNKLR